MPLYCQFQCEEYQLLIWKIEESEEELLAQLQEVSVHQLALLSYSSLRRRKEYLASRLLLQLCNPTYALSISYEASGKPYLLNEAMQVSISHTEGYAAILLTTYANPGVDIELLTPRANRLKERFLSQAELNTFSQDDDASRAVVAWSAKESLFKSMPEQDIDFRDHLYLALPPCFIVQGAFKSIEHKTASCRAQMIYYKLFEDFVLTFTYVSPFM